MLLSQQHNATICDGQFKKMLKEIVWEQGRAIARCLTLNMFSDIFSN